MREETSLQYLQQLPKAELHVHLEGAIKPATVLELARRHSRLDVLPAADEAGLQSWFKFQDFRHFIKIYLAISDLLRTPEDFELIAYQLGADMAAQNILYREATFTPYTHVEYQDKGLSIQDILAGLDRGRLAARRDFGVEIRWIFDIPRDICFKDSDGHYDSLPAEKTVEYALIGRPNGVVGLGLGGNEVNAPALPFAHAFESARREGLARIPHAGETMGPVSVWEAIDFLGAQRVGHGVRSIQDPQLVKTLAERGIVLDINPTSNICLHVYEDFAMHPFKQLDRSGVLVTVNSDDPALFNTSLVQEYKVLAKHFGYKKADLLRIARNAFLYASVEEPVKSQLLQRFDAYTKIHETGKTSSPA